jgi:hypothetical protein
MRYFGCATTSCAKNRDASDMSFSLSLPQKAAIIRPDLLNYWEVIGTMPIFTASNLWALLITVLAVGIITIILFRKLPWSFRTRATVFATLEILGILIWIECVVEPSLPGNASYILSIIGVVELISLISTLLFFSRWREKLIWAPLHQIEHLANGELHALIAVLLPVEIALLAFPILVFGWTVNAVPACRLTLSFFAILAAIFAMGVMCLVASLRKPMKQRWIIFGTGLFCLGLAIYFAVSYIVRIIM